MEKWRKLNCKAVFTYGVVGIELVRIDSGSEANEISTNQKWHQAVSKISCAEV